jgi:DNA polymerase-3 subunit delta
VIYLLHGDDDFTMGQHVSSMKQGVLPADVRDFNVSVLDGAQVSADELISTCSTAPFLAEKRLVIVEGLVSRFERLGASRSRAKEGRGPVPLGAWEGLAEFLSRAPETTEIVFADGPLTRSNPLFAAIQPHATVRPFPLPDPRSLAQWIRGRAAAAGIEIEHRAIDTLARTIGSDLRVIASELEKLSLFRSGAPIRHEDVLAMVSYTRDANIFAAVDAILEGRAADAVRMAHQILESGRPASYLLAMLARQLRLLILAKDLKSQGVPTGELGTRLGLSGYPLRKTLDQEQGFTPRRLVQLHGKLLEADLSIKSSALGEGVIIDLLVAELASAAHWGPVAGRR